MIRHKLFFVLGPSLLSTSAWAGSFHHDGVTLKTFATQLESLACGPIDPLPPPLANHVPYMALWDETAAPCARWNAAYHLLEHLTSDQDQSRYMSIRYLYTMVNEFGREIVQKKLSSFNLGSPSGHYEQQLMSQTSFMAAVDRSHIAEYARYFSSGHPSLMNLSITGLDLSKRTIEGEHCYHTPLVDVDLSQSTWYFHTVTRFCNFTGGKGDGATFKGWLYMQTFDGTSLRDSRFELFGNLASVITFKGCDLTGARFVGDMSQVQFIGSDLTGASINGQSCSDSHGTGCLVAEPEAGPGSSSR